MEQPAEDSSVFAERLEQLFAGVPNADGKRYTLGQLARRSTDMGYPISETYLSHLRTGRAKSPSLKTAAGIAAAFGVDVRYFLDDETATRTKAELDYARLRADTNVHAVAFRLAGLDSGDLEVVNDLIRSFRKRRGLPLDPPDLPEE
ncbi:helix-turn-helix domain-containing protein [Rhodococcus erythropolis]|jgi:transcriptional regulator with XRE-family HTH domain|uniref:helix-turn-helix domain-containing protein n=1 Tax=Rhodococcus erythropolis TaxID=1833 RepID=UPI0022B51FA6|nr:helix-turn-helix domain-containing protein [Rhodococcus erythropolis]MCZ4645109.1 helix-turn-helix domain-containing protein [Rhodococcus erythropolis]